MLTHGHIGGVNLYFTIIGHLPEFCIGMFLARNDETELRIPLFILLIALITYTLGNIFELFWYVNHLSFLVLLLGIFNFIIPIINKGYYRKKFFMFFGTISMSLFLVNGFLRKPFVTWAINYDQWLLTIVLCLTSLCTSILAGLMLQKGEVYIMKLLRPEKSDTTSL